MRLPARISTWRCTATWECSQPAAETVEVHDGQRIVTGTGRCYYHQKLADGLIAPAEKRRRR
jgi:hypothetical protein